MNTNEQLIHTFYTAFKNKDYKTMQQCYADTATFSDPAFGNLNATQARAMWQMLLTSSKDLALEYSQVKADENTGSAYWVAQYTFSKTGNKVVNKIKASFIFQDGKIVKQVDVFDFYTWAKQALGVTGLLLGWLPFFKAKVSATAIQTLRLYMAKNK